MSDEIRKNAQNQVEEQSAEKPQVNEAPNPAPITLSKISTGTLELATPIRARSKDVTVLHYDFNKLTGWEYAEAMDSDPTARNVFVVTKKQAICLFAAAAAKVTPDVDAIDIRERIGIADAQRAVQVATIFLSVSAQEAGKNTFGESQTQH